jgi:hypothetical protein
MTKVVYNSCFGGFGLSEAAKERYEAIAGKPPVYACDLNRTDPVLVQVVEELGQKASDWAANLEIAEIPSGVKFRIDDYDGSERVMRIDDYEWQIA